MLILLKYSHFQETWEEQKRKNDQRAHAVQKLNAQSICQIKKVYINSHAYR